MKKLFILLAFATSVVASAQSVAINTDGSAANAAAILDLTSTTKGFLPPRMKQTERNGIANPATGLVIYNTTENVLQIRTSTAWTSLTTAVTLPTIVIGTQQWMIENLDVVTYRNGDIIPQVTDGSTWESLTSGAWCYYNNVVANGKLYGKLYNGFAVIDSRGLAPKGWHIPTDAEWTTLASKLGGDSVAGGKMKSTDPSLFTSPNTGATNESGFTCNPGGFRANDAFYGINLTSYFWGLSSTGSFSCRFLTYTSGSLYIDSDFGTGGYSIRCVRD